MLSLLFLIIIVSFFIFIFYVLRHQEKFHEMLFKTKYKKDLFKK